MKKGKKTRNLLRIALILTLGGCSAPQKSIQLTTKTDLNSIPSQQDFNTLKKDYSLYHTINWGPDPQLKKESIRLSKEGINQEIPDRKIEFTATAWDIPLIKSYIKSQGIDPWSPMGEEIRKQLLDDHQNYTQFLLTVVSAVNPYFRWPEWTIWLEDRQGQAYFPRKTRESFTEETINAYEGSVLGKVTRNPGYKKFHEFGTLYFAKLDLSQLSPVTLILTDHKNQNRVEFVFNFSGGTPVLKSDPGPPETQKTTLPTLSPTPSAPPSPLTKEEKMKLMRAHFERATDLFIKEDYEGAIHEWQKVLDLDPNHKLAKKKIKRAEILLAQQQRNLKPMPEKEKKDLMKVHFTLATEHFKAGNYQEAITEWEKVLELEPEHALSKEKIMKAEELLGLAPRP